jgi:phosphocarrier protein
MTPKSMDATSTPSRINLAKVLRFIEKADQLNSCILIEINETTVNAKSLLGMCMLATRLTNCSVTLHIFGMHAEIALECLRKGSSN